MIVEYENGRLELNIDAFFPTSKARVNKLYRQFFLIAFDGPAGFVDEIIQNIDHRIPVMEDAAKRLANEYVELKTRVAELQEQVRNKKKANGLPFRGDELKEYREKLQTKRQECSEVKKAYDQQMRDLKKLKENRLTLLQLDGRC